MSKFSKGDNIKNTTLQVLGYESNSRVRCKCSKCGQGEVDKYVSMVYNEADLISGKVSCRFCAEKNKATLECIYTHRDIYMEILAKNSPTDLVTMPSGSRCLITNMDDLERKDADIATQFPLGGTYGSLVAIAYLTTIKNKDIYGVHYTKPTKIALKCTNCEYIVFVNLKDINKVKHACPLCDRLEKKMLQSKERKLSQYLVKDVERSNARDFKFRKTEFSKIETNKSMQKSVKVLEEKNKGYKVVDITKDGGATSYHLVCEKCGSIVTCMRRNSKIEECSFCKDIEDKKDYTRKGYLFKDYVGVVFNGLRVISQSGLTCEVECIKCKKRRTVQLYGVLSRNYYCDCERSKIDVFCPECDYLLPARTYNEVYTSNISCNCPSCNTLITNEDFLFAVSTSDYASSLRSKLNMANEGISDKAVKRIRFGNRFATEDLIAENEPVYKGNDEKSYFRCFCKVHNVGLLLSEDEIKNYDHRSCYDSRQKIIANPDADSIKLS